MWHRFLDWLDASYWRWVAVGLVCLAAVSAVGQYRYAMGLFLVVAALAFLMGAEHAKRGKG